MARRKSDPKDPESNPVTDVPETKDNPETNEERNDVTSEDSREAVDGNEIPEVNEDAERKVVGHDTPVDECPPANADMLVRAAHAKATGHKHY